MKRLGTTSKQTVTCLHTFLPPDAIIHIGVGKGIGDIHNWQDWDIHSVLLVDADEQGWAQNLVENKENWHIQRAVLADTEQKSVFYHASSPSESGLLAPKLLTSVWSNLHCTEKKIVTTQTLDAILQKETLITISTAKSTWLIIDCLNALSILQGATKALNYCDVLWMRTLLNPIDHLESNSLTTLKNFLASFDFRCVSIIEENHPAIGYVFFVRNKQKQLNKLESSYSDLHTKNNKLQEEISNLTQNLNKHTKSVDASQQKSAKLSKKNIVLQQQIKEKLESINILESSLQQEQQNIAYYKKTITKLENTKKITTEKKQQLQTEIKALMQHKVENETQISDLKKTKSSQEQQINHQKTQIDQYKKEIDDFHAQFKKQDHHQALIDKEFDKVESQIELIKDVLLKETVL